MKSGMKKKTLFEKVWEAHVVTQEEASPALLAIDLHLIHEVTSPQAFTELRGRGIKVRRPDRTVATMDHSTPTSPLVAMDAQASAQLEMLARNCAESGIQLHARGSATTGIVHVIGPELGLTHPGMTVVCGDSHTSTHGAFGALAFGIGTSEVAQVLATQCVLARKPRTLEVRVEGALPAGVTAKDVILALIAEIGAGGANGHVIEYTGAAIRALDMEGRMTVCNMSIEAGARAGMIAPDETTFAWLRGRPGAPKDWDDAVARWKTLATDRGATYDRTVTLDASKLEPMITYGTNPGMGVGIRQPVPRPEGLGGDERQALEKALTYMDLEAGAPLLGHKIDVVFVGSCTNSRLGDLRQAARVMDGRKVAAGVRMLVVPGSAQVKREAEAEGLDAIFVRAGAEWREPGCSMCIAMNGDALRPGEYAVSTSNRNFEGRQGPGGRTFLASPLTAAAAAVSGKIVDPREFAGGAAGWTEARAARSHETKERGGSWPRGQRPTSDARIVARSQRDDGNPAAPPATMTPFHTVRSRAVLLPVADIDTDRIIPARFLKTTEKTGLGEKLFSDWPGFPREAARGAEILVAGPNFGCGSSREHAVWALLDFGFRVVIAPSFADIFRGNALKNGLLPVALEGVHTEGELLVDLDTQTVIGGDGSGRRFEVESFAKRLLLAGQDELGYLLSFLPRVEAFEARAT